MSDTPLWDAPASAAGWPASYDRVILDEVDSTMSEARRRADALHAPTWILARSQTAAHGRRGRAWANPPGNFAATLVSRPNCTPAQAALRSFVMSLALFETLSIWAPEDRLSLKWPNDVLLSGGKLAGILLEATGPADQVTHLAIGVGINLRTAPDTSAIEADALRPVALGADAPPEDVLYWLAGHFAEAEARFQSQGFAPIREAWLRHATRLGQVITARTGQDSWTGKFETVDEAGNLVLLTSEGRRAIPAADVYF